MGINFNYDLTQQPKVVLQVKMMGVYAAGTDYSVGDAVTYNGGTYYMHTDAAAGTLPTDTTKWQAINSPNDYVESLTSFTLTNATTDNTISVDQNGNVGTDVATDGAVHIENTGNTGIGLGVYSEIGATGAAPLVSIVQNNSAFTEAALYVEGNGDLLGEPTPKGVVHFKYTGTHFNDGPLLFLDVQGTGNTQALWIETPVTTTGTGHSALFMDTRHEGQGIFVDHKSAGASLIARQTLTDRTSASGSRTVEIKRIPVVTDGATYTNAGVILEVTGSLPTETSGTITNTVVVAEFSQNDPDATGSLMKINNAGTGSSLIVTPGASTGTGDAGVINIRNTNNERTALNIYSNNATSVSSNGLLQINNANSANPQPLMLLTQSGSGEGITLDMNAGNEGIKIDHDDTGTTSSFLIDRDGNNAARIFGMQIVVDNAGTGNLVGGIDFSGMSDTEPLFKLTSTDTDLSSKNPESDAEAGWFPVLVGTTIYAVPIYDLS